ncbi:MAG: ATP-binding protein [Deltaproteobacteria bacterium]|jgi:signal transduction histidine kinase|nr:ATP-binding protein [Deltaproteobacteria bacterium]MDH3773594.1 ATP-binding protein [Deltaproteobacteria bacterium]MDH3897137.1 ATP-binding protein [Deltaproteobacteria bacterium]MDH3963175.1 ATP-binding protein [Deltaproteobacteria bacterium]
MQNGSPTKPSQKVSSISRRFSYALIGVVTLMLVGFAAFAIFFNISKMEGELEERLNNSLELAQISLPKPLWNVDKDIVRDFIKSLFLDKSIVYAKVLWGNLVITERKHEKFEQKDFSYFESSSTFIAKTSDIVYAGQKVGTIQLVMSREIIKKELIVNISVIVNLTLVIIAAISVTSVFITRRYISRPLLELQNSATAIAQGDLEAFIDTSSSDEIGSLAKDLDVMRDSIKQLFGELSDSKDKLEEYSRTLEQKVEVRTQELARSVEELKALGEVSQAVSSTLDLQKVLATIVAHAADLSGAESGAIYEFNEPSEEFQLRATHRMSEELIQAIREGGVKLGETALGWAGVNREAVQIPDILEEPTYPTSEIMKQEGFRALLAVPLFREDRLIGGLVVRRRAPGQFQKETVDLLQTFATQSALAIQNARLFREIEAKGRELEIASKHKSDFLANMSHELRTPLNAILGYTELILDKIYGDVPENIQEVLERVEKNGRHLLGLINDVLDLSKIEAGQLVLSLDDYSMKEVVHTVFTSVESLAAEKNLELKVSVAPEVAQGKGDHQRISQVFLNLVGNAIKFTEAGEVRVEATASDDTFVISVSDTGPGLSEADQQMIFEEFHQADGSSTRKKGGTGLGLSIARRIVEMHGGRIWVESTEGKGSTFWFTLPVRVERQKEQR